MSFTENLSEDSYLVTFEVSAHQQRIRLDSFLKTRYRRRSREQIKRAIDAGSITVRREQAAHLMLGRLKPSFQLLPGDEVLVVSERKPEPEVSFDYKILFEDEALLIVEKPANLPVHPAGRYFFNTLLIHLKTHGHKEALKSEHQYYLPHRIDKETSGILVMTKTQEACAHLVRQFAERTTEKRYLAIVRGIPPEENFEINAAMKRATGSRIELKMIPAPESEGGLSAVTFCRRLETAGNYSLIECHPKTGRQHQIRVHLDSIGHPIVGDKLYGIPEEISAAYYERRYISPELEARLLLPRHALHAAGIRFTHPLTKLKMEFRSELPAELRAFLDQQKSLN